MRVNQARHAFNEAGGRPDTAPLADSHPGRAHVALTAQGVPWVQAEGEGEATCAALNVSVRARPGRRMEAARRGTPACCAATQPLLTFAVTSAQVLPSPTPVFVDPLEQSQA